MSDYKTLKNISILFFSFVLILLLINIFTKNHYARSNNQVVDLVKEDNYLLDYKTLHEIINAEKQEDYILIDLRNEEEYMAGNLKGSENIPFASLMEASNQQRIKKLFPRTPVLYSNSEAESHMARMLLISRGLDPAIKIAPGTYETILAFASEEFDPAYATYREDKAKFDYPRYMQVQPASERGSKDSSRELPEAKTVTTSVQGGC